MHLFFSYTVRKAVVKLYTVFLMNEDYYIVYIGPNNNVRCQYKCNAQMVCNAANEGIVNI